MQLLDNNNETHLNEDEFNNDDNDSTDEVRHDELLEIQTTEPNNGAQHDPIIAVFLTDHL